MDPYTISTGAALSCATLVRYLGSEQSELASEVLCWLLLPCIFQWRRPRTDTELAGTLPHVGAYKVRPAARSSPSSTTLWIVAVCITTLSVFRAGWGLIVLFPASTPILLTISRKSVTHETRNTTAGASSLLVNTTLGTTLVALLAISSLSGISLVELGPSLVPLLAIVVICVGFEPNSHGKYSSWLGKVNIATAINPLSRRVGTLLLIALGLEWTVFGFPRGHVIFILSLAPLKALLWFYVSEVARDSSWLAATVTGTFAILASRNPFAESSHTRALMHVVASIFALGQSIQLAPNQAKSRSALWALSLIPIVPYVANLAAIHHSQSSPITEFRNHPVEILSWRAKSSFKHLLANQSTTYEAAERQYRLRYGLEPPPGFEEWYNFAVSNRSPIIDDFDIIHRGIAPFLSMSGASISDAMAQVYIKPDSEVWQCKISGREPEVECRHPWRTNDRFIAGMLRLMVAKMPDTEWNITLLVNHLDEPRVTIPPGYTNYSDVKVTGKSGSPVWDIVTKSCSTDEIHKGEQKPAVETYGLPFVTDRDSALDLCRNPSHRDMHGLFLSPTSFPAIEGLVPVLSVGAPSSMGDILWPSPAYAEAEFAYDGARDIPWDKKEDKLYWAGSTTGGYANDDSIWRKFHRQRFIELAQNLKRRAHIYLRQGTSLSLSSSASSSSRGIIRSVASRFLNSRLYDVSFTRMLQCGSKATCRSERAYFGGTSPWADRDAALRARLAFDIDGNGISGRFYRLLASQSAPLKMTVLHEWHDDRLIPWLHYIPVSLSMEELPELVHYLTSTEAGRERARSIADQGRWWYSKAFREVDQAIYVYRLLLEMARLQDPDRQAYGGEGL